jgi:hypothetical protein
MAAPYFGLMGGVVDATKRFNLGGPDYTDSQGRLWAGYTNGVAFDYRANGYVPVPPGIASTDDDALYWTVLYSSATMLLPVPAGVYSLTAHYCECFNDYAGGRSSGLLDRNHQVLIGLFDVYSAAGGRNIAYQMPAQFTAVADAGGLTLYLPVSGNDNATICAIEALKIA